MTTGSLKRLTATHFIQKWSVFVLFLLVCFMFRVGLCDNVGNTLEEESAHFDVKPGGEINVYTRDWDGFHCIFTYACQGGTKEQWMMTLKRSINKKYSKCLVFRPSGNSYLFFEQFSVQIKGPQIQSAKLLANNGKPLSPEQYKIEKSKNTVTHTNEKFNSELTFIEIDAIRHKKKKEL